MADANEEERQYYLRRTQLLNELQGELLSWGRRQFWLVSLIVGVLAIGGYFGVANLVQSTVREVVEREAGQMRREAWEAAKAAALAQESTAKARTATEEATKRTEAYAETVGALQERAKQVDTQFLAVLQRLEAESANLRVAAAKDVKDVTARLARLEELVAKMARDSEASRQAVETYQKEVAALKAAAQAEASRFASNAAYRVTVYFNDSTRDLSAKAVEILAQAGFKTSSASVSVFDLFSKSPSLGGGRTVNSIVYDPKEKAKAEGIRILLSSLVRDWKLVESKAKRVMLKKGEPQDFPAAKEGELSQGLFFWQDKALSYQGKYLAELADIKGYIEVYLVQKGA